MKSLRIITAGIIVACACFTAFIGKNIIADKNDEKVPAPYKGIISMWQVDSFEGGTGSRKQFLLKAARGFEKTHEGVLIMVVNYTAEGVKENLEKGVYPDIVSFGGGTEISGFSEIEADTDFAGGKVGEKVYAAAWCRGGYALIYNPALTDGADAVIENLLVSQGEYTQPMIAAMEEELKIDSFEVKKPMDAYVKFVCGKTAYMIGTQRDIMRFNNRGTEVGIKPLSAFNDLYQYAAVTSKDQTKRYYAEEFVKYLLSDEVQEKLSDIGMYSVEKRAIYEDEKQKTMQAAEGFKTLSAFTSPEELKNLQYLSALAADGNAEAVNKIKNVLILP